MRELTARFKDHPAIAGWLLTNEMPIYGDWKSRGNGALRAEAVISWAQILIDAVRAGGGYQPVCIGEGAWGVEITAPTTASACGTSRGWWTSSARTSTAWRPTRSASTSAPRSSANCSTSTGSRW